VPIVRANPNEFLLVGRRGELENRGSAVQAVLLPGTVWVLVPAAKQEAAFEFTQETRDGIPLRFKGIIVYRITDPIAAARQFDFANGAGVVRISTLLTRICLGELRHAVSHMTMVECIEQRKTTLSAVAATALEATLQGGGGQVGDWGITIEVAQLAQVYIVDANLRAQLEAEVRNEIKLKSDESDIRTLEQTRLAEMTSQGRVDEQKLESDQESLRRTEALEMAQVARDRRMQAERVATEQLELKLGVVDSPNSAGVVIDALRCAKLALDAGIGGALLGPSAYFMKSPPVQYRDEEAREMVEDRKLHKLIRRTDLIGLYAAGRAMEPRWPVRSRTTPCARRINDT